MVATLLFGIALVLWLPIKRRALAVADEMHHARRETERAVARRGTLERDLAAVRRETIALQEILEATTATLPKSASPSPPKQRGALEIPALLTEHPEWRPAYEAGARGEVLLRYLAFMETAVMSAAQRDAFAAECVRHAEKQAEARIASREQNWAADDPRLLALQRAEEARHAAELGRLLGDDGNRKLEDFNRTLSVRDLVGELAQQLYYTDAPLTRATAERLTRVFAQHAVTPQGQVDRHALDWDAAIAAASSMLAPEQIAALGRVHEQEQLQRRMNQIMRRAAKRPIGRK